jgi:membrane-bound serine protease (ClpP class)
MDHATIAILMLFFGLALIIAEFFIPSGGMIAILAAICLSVSVWGAYQAWWETARSIWWSYLAMVALLIPVSAGGGLFLIQRTSLGRHVLLRAPDLEEVTPYAAEERHLRQMIGKRGETVSLLNPGGMVEVEGERFHCECPCMLIEAFQEVEVTGIKGNRLLVRPASGLVDRLLASRSQPDRQIDESSSGEPAADQGDDDAPPLDFDIPQS